MGTQGTPQHGEIGRDNAPTPALAGCLLRLAVPREARLRHFGRLADCVRKISACLERGVVWHTLNEMCTEDGHSLVRMHEGISGRDLKGGE
jgi:hypothetical protein